MARHKKPSSSYAPVALRSAQEIVEEFYFAQGWTSDTVCDLLLRFIDEIAPQETVRLRDFLAKVAKTENQI